MGSTNVSIYLCTVGYFSHLIKGVKPATNINVIKTHFWLVPYLREIKLNANRPGEHTKPQSKIKLLTDQAGISQVKTMDEGGGGPDFFPVKGDAVK